MIGRCKNVLIRLYRSYKEKRLLNSFGKCGLNVHVGGGGHN